MSKAKVKVNHNNTNNNNIESESDESNPSTNLDLSLLRRPIETSITGFEEVLRAYEAGTNELRKLLSKECDLIYECKVCRNIFRSLTNFISHKRVYCRSSFNTSEHFHFRNNGFMVQDISTIIQAEQKINNNPNGVAGTLPGNDDKSKDLSGIVEQLLWKQHQSRNSNVNDFYDQIQTSSSRKDESSAKSSKTQTLKLNRVNDSDIAVYQSLQTENENSNMQDEINEVHKMLTKSNTVLGPDGKILKLFNSNSHNNSPALSTTDEIESLTCQVCNVQFDTEKTLKLHLEMKHLPSSYVYQCPSCPQKFSSSAAVIRHLSNDHKKSNRRIRLMRDNIIKKRVRADEAVSKAAPGTSRELQKLQISNGTDAKNENYEWNEHDFTSQHSDQDYTCPSCMKKFDRKAVYTSHVQICSDIKDREQEKMKKRKAKDGAKSKNIDTESEQDPQAAQQENSVNKRKRQRTSKVKIASSELPVVPKIESEQQQEDSTDVVDWNLDDEEENKRLDNIKKEIIEDEYKKTQDTVVAAVVPNVEPIKLEVVENNQPQHEQEDLHDDDEDSGLIIDEKADDESGQFKCTQCDKVFESDDKLKYHLTFYHSRQKRFKCKMCEYQGYRKKDTMNHINFVHNAGVTMETLGNHIETVSKAVDEESVAKLNELKRAQLKIKRKMARERHKKKLAEAKLKDLKKEDGNVSEQTKESENLSTSDHSLPPTVPIVKAESSSSPTKIKIEKKSDEDEISPRRRESTARACKSPSISHFGKIVKNAPVDSDGNQRPIRNRIKPVRKDFLYDLSDLLKKEADAYREQVFQSTNVMNVKRELRKRAMSTHTREMPNISTFDQPIKKVCTSSPADSFVQPLGPPPIPNSDENTSPLKSKDQRNRRMSVFVTSPRQIYSAQPRSPPYKPPDAGTHKNAGAAHKMALVACENNQASMYEPKFFWTVNFEQGHSRTYAAAHKNSTPTNFASTSQSSSSSNISAASSILQKLSGRVPSTSSSEGISLLKEKPKTSTTAELCKKFELINVTNINENEFDIPDSHAINLNPGGNNLVSLTLSDNDDDDVCVLQECSAESEIEYEDDDDEEEEEEEEEDIDDDSEPKLEIESEPVKSPSKRGRRSKKSSEKRKSSTNGRLTVMQRLQENKIRKSRESLFQRLMSQQSENDEDVQNDSPSSSNEFDLFSET